MHREAIVDSPEPPDFRIARHLTLGAGGVVALLNFVPDALAPLNGGHNPTGAMPFVRNRLDRLTVADASHIWRPPLSGPFV